MMNQPRGEVERGVRVSMTAPSDALLTPDPRASYALVGAAELPPSPVINGAFIANLEAKLYPPSPVVPPAPSSPEGWSLA
jgi:hypothetical protein